ncbi:helicase associated domain-containing protein [Streptomyces albogriseolus]|uniref:helicase associated domain-containing protein n=1 Tax=Streptomyces albogriseolus TaxID=1887 RepID=UPI00374F5CD1
MGRALRMHPGEGKAASLVVPVLLGPGETADNMLTSRAFGGLAKLLEALRAHDARVVEQLAEQQAQSGVRGVRGAQSCTSSAEETGADGDRSVHGLSMPARQLLKFSTPRDPAQLAAFINLRVLNPEHAYWRRGIEDAVIYQRLHGDLKVPFTYRVPGGEGQAVEGEEWPASLAGFPLGQWIADGASTPAAVSTRTASSSWRSWAWCGRTSTSRGRKDSPPPAGGRPNTATSWPRWTPPTRATG